MSVSAKKRAALSLSQFALPEKRKYPMDTIGRARNALSRAAQQYKRGNLTSSEYAKIKRRVHAKWPSIGD